MLTKATDAVASCPVKRLAAIMFADVVDFTAFTSEDEDHAIAVLHDFLTLTVHPMLQEFDADTRKDLGDGILATFQDVNAAVSCAEKLQAVLAGDRGTGTPRWKGLRLRIAIHYSDIRYMGDDVFGAGVNLAKRLQEAAATDGVIISHAVCEQIRPERSSEIRDLGFVALRGFDRPVRAYDLASGPASSLRTLRAKEEIPSIAIMPFENLSAARIDTYFAEGLVEDIIGSLSGLREMVVISRGSTLGFRERHVDPLDARRILGVRYVLQGTIRRWQGTIRLSATLSDTEDGATMFSTRSDVHEDQFFQQQDRIVSEIVTSIAPRVRQAELMRAMRKPPEVFSAYDCLLKALDLMRELSRERYEEARGYLDQAIKDDANFATAYSWRASWWIMMVVQGWIKDRDLATSEAEKNAKRAVKLDGTNAQALAVLAQTAAFLRGDYAAALALMERARRAGPGNTFVMMISAGLMAYVGRGQDAVMYAEQAHQLIPLDRIPFREFDWLALAHYSAGNYQHAAYWARRALDEEQGHLPSLRLLAASLVADGDVAAAQKTAQVLLSHAPDFRLTEYATAHATFADEGLQETWIEHLRAAGVPN